ncbi:TPA: hypothetical protein N0F65_000377 [Lagenidium giganteum]|uniref:LicD/FKTN/FKRP nucleotidyltransferase domain-containing protein n=1 Tax=Lagenidium giganteum TaxID=4803 RepID=A0AAV2YYJ4_9STRA|nr:TPA: hypothetical protein N0F65_000377 [Lagenidium giganteum]
MAAARREDPSACVELSPNHLVGEFAQPDKCWTRRQVQAILISIVHEFSTLLERYNVRYWVDSGTLLGAVRHNGLIPFDQDVDFGIEQAGYELLRDTRVDVPDGFALHVYESAVNDVGRVDNAIPIRFVHRASGLYADVFAFLDKVDAEGRHSIGPIPSLCFGGCAHCPSTGSGRREFRIPREWVFPLRQCRFEYFLVACPNDSHRYLTHMFGDYSTPYAD